MAYSAAMSDKLRAVAGMESAPLHDGAVLFNPTSGKFIMLNGSAAFIWEALAATPATEEELAGKLCDNFDDVDPSTALQDARDAVSRLRELDMIASGDD